MYDLNVYLNKAEKHIKMHDPESAAIDLRSYTETFCKEILTNYSWYRRKVDEKQDITTEQKINEVWNCGFIDKENMALLHKCRRLGNKGAHGEHVSMSEAASCYHAIKNNHYVFLSYIESAKVKCSGSSKSLNKPKAIASTKDKNISSVDAVKNTPTVKVTTQEPIARNIHADSRNSNILFWGLGTIAIIIIAIVFINIESNTKVFDSGSAVSSQSFDGIESQSNPGYRTYTVQKGDTLSEIARMYFGEANRYPDIMKLNGLTSDLIEPGMTLLIPDE